eukprot:2453186-Rhodomonas_salina.5
MPVVCIYPPSTASTMSGIQRTYTVPNLATDPMAVKDVAYSACVMQKLAWTYRLKEERYQ